MIAILYYPYLATTMLLFQFAQYSVQGANHDYLVILVLHQMALSSHSLAFSHPELGSEV